MSKTEPKRLTKSNDKKLAGVIGGVSEYFNVDPTLLRLAFIFMVALTGFFPLVFAYIIAAIVMPEAK